MRQGKVEYAAGFTLVEIMIVVCVIAILAALAIPGFIRIQVQANEAATQRNLRTVSSMTESYRSIHNPPIYPPDLATLVNSNPAYLDRGWLNTQRQGYLYTYASAASGGTYSVGAVPQNPNVTGIRSFCIDHTGVIRVSVGGHPG